VLAKVCGNCHSERTEWPLYSYLPGVSWALEKDVAEARAHLNLSHWSEYSAEERRDLLGRIAAEARSHEMPPARYTMLHPEARLSQADIEAIGEWTKTQRHLLRNPPGINQAPRESSSMP
jgi:cytochrome c